MNTYRFTFNFTNPSAGPPVGARRIEFEADNDSVAEDVAANWENFFGSFGTGSCNTVLERVDYTVVATHTY